MRKLASIRKVKELLPIEGKDRIELAIIDGWSVIVKKDEFKPNDLCIYVEIDSLMPETPDFEFLRSKKFKIKTMKMSGVISQGICFPLSLLKEGKWKEGDDVTDILKIKKVEDETEEVIETKSKSKVFKFLNRYKIFRNLMKLRKFDNSFPDFVSKTDETRVQNIPSILKSNELFYAHEKIDGQSGTFTIERGFFNRHKYKVCSRNLNVKKDMSTSYWQVYEKYNIKSVLNSLLDTYKAKTVVIQGECISPRVQKNKYCVKEADLFCFNLYIDGVKISSILAEDILKGYDMKWVPILYKDFVLPSTIDELVKLSTGTSILYNTYREGIVFRNYDNTKSFKVISPEFLLKHNL